MSMEPDADANIVCIECSVWWYLSMYTYSYAEYTILIGDIRALYVHVSEMKMKNGAPGPL